MEKHCSTSKHLKPDVSNPPPLEEIPKSPLGFLCELCDYKTSNKKDFRKHTLTIKHQSNINPNIPTPAAPKLSYACACGKIYKHSSTLSTHKKNCTAPPPPDPLAKTDKDDKEENPVELAFLSNLVLEVMKSNADLMKQNQEFQKQMFDMCKSATTNNNINNNNTNNNHNKTFNMQVFLNEQCKDAMNIMDFVNSMTLELSDLEDVGEVGYVEGISKIIIRKLNELDVCKRPIHCSDFKREIMYVKDMDVWSKENSTFDKIRKAIKYVTKKNSDLLIPWIQKYPAGMNIEHPQNDIYMRLMNQAMGGRESFIESENKIIKKISKAVQIDKNYKC